jgi:hypothetical protein
MADIDPRTALIGIPLAIILFFAVGLRVSSARNEAAGPLVGRCPAVIWNIVTGGFGVLDLLPYTKCVAGVAILVMIPGAFGIGLMALRGR